MPSWCFQSQPLFLYNDWDFNGKQMSHCRPISHAMAPLCAHLNGKKQPFLAHVAVMAAT